MPKTLNKLTHSNISIQFFFFYYIISETTSFMGEQNEKYIYESLISL